jgi:hypothetical protein
LKIADSVDGPMKESLQRAFDYLQSQKVNRRLSDAGGRFVTSVDMRYVPVFFGPRRRTWFT